MLTGGLDDPTQVVVEAIPPPNASTGRDRGRSARPWFRSDKALVVACCIASTVLATHATVTLYTLEAPRPVVSRGGATYERFLAVDELEWDYAPPNGTNLCHGHPLERAERVFVRGYADGARFAVGSVYKKRQFVEHADGEFSQPLPHPPEWAHLGYFGPVLRARVGDTLVVRVRNRSRFPVSMHIPGLAVAAVTHFGGPRATTPLARWVAVGGSPGSSGSNLLPATTTVAGDPYGMGYMAVECELLQPSGSPLERDAANACARSGGGGADSVFDVPPGRTVSFEWVIPEAAGPRSPLSSAAHLYRTGSYGWPEEPALSGVLVVSAAESNANGPPARPADVDAEAVVILASDNEPASPLAAVNVLDRIVRPMAKVQRGVGAVNGTAASGASSAAVAATERPPFRPGSPVIPLETVDAVDVLVALYNAAAAIVTAAATQGGATGSSNVVPPPTTITRAAAAAALARSDGMSPSVSIQGLQGVPLRLLFYTTPPDVDATGYALAYGQATLEQAVAPLLMAALQASPGWSQAEYEEAGRKHTFAGHLYCSQPPAIVRQGSRVRWYVAVVGGALDMHSLHWHSNTVVYDGLRSDSLMLVPGSVYAVDMTPRIPGIHAVHCHVSDHSLSGMFSRYHVLPASPIASSAAALSLADIAAQGTDVAPYPSPLPPAQVAAELDGVTREYFIAAEVEQWQYADSEGLRECSGLQHAPPPALASRVNVTMPKARYVQYTDASFTTRLARSVDEQHLSILGPLLRAVVGDMIRVTFLNRTPRPFSFHCHGVLYHKSAEGARYDDGTYRRSDTGDDAVPPGGQWVHTLFVPEASGPGPSDVSSILWLYHGHTHEVSDENVGLVGAIIVTGRGKQRSAADLRPADVDREFVLLAKAFNEDQAGLGGAVANATATTPSDAGAAGGGISWDGGGAQTDTTTLNGGFDPQLHFTVNGRSWCSLRGLVAHEGDRVRLHVAALGNEVDVHTVLLEGHTLVSRGGHRVGGVPLIAGVMTVADVVAAHAGDYAMTTAVSRAASAGLVQRFAVLPSSSSADTGGAQAAAGGGTVHKHYIAAEEVMWDYIPRRTDCLPDEVKPRLVAYADDGAASVPGLRNFPLPGRKYVSHPPGHLGASFKKVRYVEYADASFAIARVSIDAGLGILGPLMSLASDDVLEVVFLNRLAFAVNIAVPHGLQLLELHELTPSATGPPSWTPVPNQPVPRDRFPVPPGGTVRYRWLAPLVAGPGPADGPSIVWRYESTVHANHLHAGLLGGIQVRSAAVPPGGADANHGADTTRDLLVAAVIMDETLSPFFEANAAAQGVPIPSPPPGTPISGTRRPRSPAGASGALPGWVMHAINGRIFCNLDGFTARTGQHVRVHVLSAGTEPAVHSPSFHGLMASVSDVHGTVHASSSLQLAPGAAGTLDFVAPATGDYLLECGVSDHRLAGMAVMLHVV